MSKVCSEDPDPPEVVATHGPGSPSPVVDSRGASMVNALRMNVAAPAAQTLAVEFGGEQAVCEGVPGGLHVTLPIPVLAGQATEVLASWESDSGEDSDASGPPAWLPERVGHYEVLRNGAHVAGVAVCSVNDDLEAVSHACYRQLFELLGERHHAYRIWHYVPDINRVEGGLENYRKFNIGRRRAFDDRFGSQAEAQMPAASAVGTSNEQFVMAFVGGRTPPHFLENPRQTPAYRYPTDYGPKSPSFARAAVVGSAAFVSGTASIQGHETVHQGDVLGQFDVTVANLEELARGLGLESWKAVTERPGYQLKVYLRHKDDLAILNSPMASELAANAANTTVLHTDICRADLDVEIEALFSLD